MTDLNRLDALRRAAGWLHRAEDHAVREVGEALTAWLDGGADHLDDALGIRPQPGQLRPSTVAAIERRNDHLRQAAERFNLSAHHLAEELARYAASSWLRERAMDECPARLHGRLQECLWHALRAWPRAIGEKQLRAIMEIKPPYSFPPNRETVDRNAN